VNAEFITGWSDAEECSSVGGGSTHRTEEWKEEEEVEADTVEKTRRRSGSKGFIASKDSQEAEGCNPGKGGAMKTVPMPIHIVSISPQPSPRGELIVEKVDRTLDYRVTPIVTTSLIATGPGVMGRSPTLRPQSAPSSRDATHKPSMVGYHRRPGSAWGLKPGVARKVSGNIGVLALGMEGGIKGDLVDGAMMRRVPTTAMKGGRVAFTLQQEQLRKTKAEIYNAQHAQREDSGGLRPSNWAMDSTPARRGPVGLRKPPNTPGANSPKQNKPLYR